MRTVVRLAGIGVCGIALYYVGVVGGLLYSEAKPQPVAAVLVVALLACVLVLLVRLVSETGRGDSRGRANGAVVAGARWMWLLVSVFALVGLTSLLGILAPPQPDATQYHNDAIALNQCAAKLFLQGQNPYTSLDLYACYDELGIGPDRTTPLRRGLLGHLDAYPSNDLLFAAWEFRRGLPSVGEDGRELDPGRPPEFVWRPSYPALSFLLVVPAVLLDIEPNWLSVLCLVAAIALVVARAEPTLRGLVLTALLASLSVVAFTMGGTSDLFYALPLVAAWLWRERRWSAVALGIACATKQIAWFAAPFYLLAVLHQRGPREAARRLALAAIPFVAANATFLILDPAAWVAGVLAPMAEPAFARGVGLVLLGTGGTLPLLAPAAYLALEIVTYAVALLAAWRLRGRHPELGLLLAYVPLFFAWRSLFSYFFLLPLFAAASVARMPLGALAVRDAARLGAVPLAVEGPRACEILGSVVRPRRAPLAGAAPDARADASP